MLGTQGMVSRAGIIPNGATMDRAGSIGRSVYDVTALFSAMAGWDAEDLITFRSMGSFPQSDWSKELQVANLAGRRLGVLREMIWSGPAHAEGRAIFEQALGDLRKGGAVVVDPVLTGIDLKTQSLAGENRTAEYEKFAFINAYLARLGPAAKFKTVEEMIEKVGREKLANSLVAAPALPPPGEEPGLSGSVPDARDVHQAVPGSHGPLRARRAGAALPHDSARTLRRTTQSGSHQPAHIALRRPVGGGAGRLCPGRPADCHPILRPPQRRSDGPENRTRLRTGEPAPAGSRQHATAPRRAFRILALSPSKK